MSGKNRDSKESIFQPKQTKLPIETIYKNRVKELPREDELELEIFMLCAIQNACVCFLCERYAENSKTIDRNSMLSVLGTLREFPLISPDKVSGIFYGILSEFSAAVALDSLGYIVRGTTTEEDAKHKVDLWALDIVNHVKYAIQIKSSREYGLHTLPNTKIDSVFPWNQQFILGEYAVSKEATPVCLTLGYDSEKKIGLMDYMDARIEGIKKLFPKIQNDR